MTLRQAAKATNKSTSTLSKAIANGRLSIVGKQGNSFQIDESELFRVFGSNVPNEHIETFANTPSDSTEHLKIIKLSTELDAALNEIQSLKVDKEDYKRRLDSEAEERRKLTMMLTDQRNEASHQKGFLQRLFG